MTGNRQILNNISIQTFFDYNTFNTPSWSISAEYYTYMIFALVFFCMKKNNLFIFISLVGILAFRINSETGLGIENTNKKAINAI